MSYPPYPPSGNPKGAMLTHGNIISNTAAFIRITEVNKHTCETVTFIFKGREFRNAFNSNVLTW